MTILSFPLSPSLSGSNLSEKQPFEGKVYYKKHKTAMDTTLKGGAENMSPTILLVHSTKN